MPHIICEPCIGTKDASCVDVCPVECIYETDDQFYIHPEECIEEPSAGRLSSARS